ncbi:peptidoglycan editing factor PgeF [Rudaea sp.]|uniref:peptidoglycan editing factor PgeF n=1 Tax=Rudaea sp. TaxID=2136325 RepID=UPI002ED67577
MSAPASPSTAGTILVPDWPVSARVRAAVTTRLLPGASRAPFDAFNLGAHCGDDPAVVAANRAALLPLLGLPGKPCWLRQVHGTNVVRFDGQAYAEEPQADGAVTSTPGVVLAVLTADCLPVVIAARDGSEVAVAHAGWKGLAGGILEVTVAAMRTTLGECIAWLGPAAGPDAYEIGMEVRDAFLAHDRGAAVAFTPTRPGHWRVDLYALARQRLADAGVRDVSGGDRCTISEAQAFFSHRRDQRTGRMATLAWIEP